MAGPSKLLDTVFLDVDGVCVDFRGASLKLFDGAPGPDDSPEYSMGKLLGISTTEFWQTVDAIGPGFWRFLPPYPWLDDLWDHLNALAHEVVYATSPSWSPHSVTGRYQWIQDRHGAAFNDFVLTRRKELLARHPDSVLIDDSTAVVERFHAAGGNAILFPQAWNGNKRPDDPVKYVVRKLEKMFGA